MCFVKEARGSFFVVQAPGVAPLSAHLLMAVPAIVLFASLGAPVFCKLQYAKPRKRGSVPIKAPQSCHFLEIFQRRVLLYGASASAKDRQSAKILSAFKVSQATLFLTGFP